MKWKPLAQPFSSSLLLSLILAGAVPATHAEDEPDTAAVVATVADRAITRSELEAEMARLPRRQRHLVRSADGHEIVLQQLIRSTLIDIDAERAGLLDDPEILARLRRARESILLSALAARRGGAAGISEAEMREYYEARKSKYVRDVPAYRTRHIAALAPRNATPEEEARARAVIEEAQARIDGGESFQAVALELTEDPAGPELGYLNVGVAEKSYEEAALALQPGEVSGPVRTDYGWHLLQLVDIKPPVNMSFEQAKAEIRKAMAPKTSARSGRRSSQRRYVAELRKQYPVSVNKEALQALAPEPPGQQRPPGR